MNDPEFQFGFIGAGKLAGSVIRGLLRAEYCSPADIIASEPSEAARARLSQDLAIRTTAENQVAAASASIIFVGVKPQNVVPVLSELGDAVADKLVVSFAAGVRIRAMEEVTSARVMRVMTNTPSAICRGATGIAAGSRSTAADLQRLFEIFSATGLALEVREDEIDAVTALAGSGPAFVYTAIEAFAAGAGQAGLQGDNALQLAAQMTRGAAELALMSGKTPEELRHMVVTPGGTTAAGLDVMQAQHVSEALAAAVAAAADRGREMSAQFGS